MDEGCRPALFATTSEDTMTEGVQGRYVTSIYIKAFFLRTDGLTSRNNLRSNPTAKSMTHRNEHRTRTGRQSMASERAHHTGKAGGCPMHAAGIVKSGDAKEMKNILACVRR